MEVDENKRIVLNEDAGGAVDEDDGDDDDDGDGDRKGEEDDAKKDSAKQNGVVEDLNGPVQINSDSLKNSDVEGDGVADKDFEKDEDIEGGQEEDLDSIAKQISKLQSIFNDEMPKVQYRKVFSSQCYGEE